MNQHEWMLRVTSTSRAMLTRIITARYCSCHHQTIMLRTTSSSIIINHLRYISQVMPAQAQQNNLRTRRQRASSMRTMNNMRHGRCRAARISRAQYAIGHHHQHHVSGAPLSHAHTNIVTRFISAMRKYHHYNTARQSLRQSSRQTIILITSLNNE